MSLTAGTLSLTSQTVVSATSVTDVITATAATGGTGPYTQQLYVSTNSGFAYGPSNLISGATALVNTVTGLIPGTQYYYQMVYTDTGNSNAVVAGTKLAVATPIGSLNPNQFALSPYLGQIDLRFPYDTVSVQVDSTQATPLYAGQAVKIVDSSDGIPKVVACAADSDNVMGFINFDIKNITFAAGQNAEISMAGNVIYLFATGAISRGVQVSLDITTIGGVAAITTGSNVVGWAYDKATTAGQLIRVVLKTPTFTTAP